jgi:hypothetical protein
VTIEDLSFTCQISKGIGEANKNIESTNWLKPKLEASLNDFEFFPLRS